MSWSIQLIGNPENICAALDAESERLTGQSKDEFDAALPHLKALVGQNVSETQLPVLNLTASGHGNKPTTGAGYNNVSCKIEPDWR